MIKNITINRINPAYAKGFTLVELLVVVAIVGVIASIAIPVYRNYITGSKRKVAQSSLEHFGILLESFRAENGSFPASGVYVYTENPAGAVAKDNITGKFADFKPRSSTATATSFHYRLTIKNAGTATENATFDAIGIKNNFENTLGINETGSYR